MSFFNVHDMNPRGKAFEAFNHSRIFDKAVFKVKNKVW